MYMLVLYNGGYIYDRLFYDDRVTAIDALQDMVIRFGGSDYPMEYKLFNCFLVLDGLLNKG